MAMLYFIYGITVMTITAMAYPNQPICLPASNLPRLLVVGGGFAGMNLIKHLPKGRFLGWFLSKKYPPSIWLRFPKACPCRSMTSLQAGFFFVLSLN
ncbi:hypothetical protein FHS56_001317 [Thermonema lapsum]|uniref:Uncharacterized protein n=1 Tax=Thermonema lapsum TaxID=28195 RepID=A0A846MQE4_9BACT|nr:hypothetical protein [Thermonema lapsum]NIK73804.1 hypothetical protein [Thermonema lapsum]